MEPACLPAWQQQQRLASSLEYCLRAAVPTTHAQPTHSLQRPHPARSPEELQHTIYQQRAAGAQQRCATQHATHPRVAQSMHELCTNNGRRGTQAE